MGEEGGVEESPWNDARRGQGDLEVEVDMARMQLISPPPEEVLRRVSSVGGGAGVSVFRFLSLRWLLVLSFWCRDVSISRPFDFVALRFCCNCVVEGEDENGVTPPLRSFVRLLSFVLGFGKRLAFGIGI